MFIHSRPFISFHELQLPDCFMTKGYSGICLTLIKTTMTAQRSVSAAQRSTEAPLLPSPTVACLAGKERIAGGRWFPEKCVSAHFLRNGEGADIAVIFPVSQSEKG